MRVIETQSYQQRKEAIFGNLFGKQPQQPSHSNGAQIAALKREIDKLTTQMNIAKRSGDHMAVSQLAVQIEEMRKQVEALLDQQYAAVGK